MRETYERNPKSEKDFQCHYLHFGVMTGYIFLLHDMNDGAYIEYLVLCNKGEVLNAKFSSYSYKIQNPIFSCFIALFQ